MKKCDLTWFILNTVVDYTKNDKDSPYKEMNYSPIYSKFEDTKDLMINQIFRMRDLRKSLVICTVVISLMTLMMSALLIWDIINLKVKREPSQLTITFL